MSPPATYEVCRDKTCGNWQDVSKLGNICTSCGRSLVNVVVERQAVELVSPGKVCPLLTGSPITGRTIYRSPSLRKSPANTV